MNISLIFNLAILSIVVLISLLYCIFVIIDETKKYNKIRYYKSTISYDINYDKYFKMVKKMKKIILFKKAKLFLLQILVFLKGIFIWKKK